MNKTILMLAGAFFFVACSGADERDGGLRPDATVVDGGVVTDGGAGTDGAVVVDAGRADAGPLRDAGPDNSLDGTTLSGIVVEWNAPLTLCSQWRETRSLAEEQAVKLMVTLEPNPRALGRIRLQEATLAGGVMRHGPLIADRVPVSAGVTSTLTNWELFMPDGDSSVDATIEHVFADGSTLEERYLVARRAGDRAPVVVGSERFESFFVYRPAGSQEVAVLEPCGGPPSLEPGIEAMVGTNAGTSVVVYRYLNTTIALAGSFPVVPTSASVVMSDRPWEVFHAHGYWAQTYSAQHHNWQEYSVIDFTRDLGWHESAYEPYIDGENPLLPDMIREVRLNDVRGFTKNGTIEIDILDLSTGNTTTRTYSATGEWRVVDTNRVKVQLAGRCTDPNVTTIMSGPERYAFHLLSCPGSTGSPFALDMLVPAALQHAPEHVGLPFDGSAIQPIVRMGRSGYAVTIGSTTLEITKAPSDEYYFVDISDGGQMITSSLMFEYALQTPEVRSEVHRFASVDGGISVDMVRRYVGQGVGESSIYALERFEMSFDGSTYVGDSWDAFDYENTHHNWADQLDATVDGLRLHWEIDFLPTETYRVSAVRESDGAVVLPLTEVVRLP